MQNNITKRDGVVITKIVKPAKKRKAKKMETISGIPLETVENVKG